MVTVEDFKYVLTLWDSHKITNLMERDIKIDLEPDKIISIAGSRRAGKTYVMFQCMNDLLQRGVKRDNILYVNLRTRDSLI